MKTQRVLSSAQAVYKQNYHQISKCVLAKVFRRKFLTYSRLLAPKTLGVILYGHALPWRRLLVLPESNKVFLAGKVTLKIRELGADLGPIGVPI
jgi:hypothetical protein